MVGFRGGRVTHPELVIEEWIQAINEFSWRLSKWETDFMESITEQFETKRWISDKQEEILERIYAEKTS